MYCRGYTDKGGKIFIRAFSMKMSSTFKKRQVRTFGGLLLRFSSLLFNTDKDRKLLFGHSPGKCHLHSKIGKLGRLEGSYYVFHHFCIILTLPEKFLFGLSPQKCHLHSKMGKLGRLEGSYYVFHHFCITSIVLLSPNEDSDFFHNQ